MEDIKSQLVQHLADIGYELGTPRPDILNKLHSINRTEVKAAGLVKGRTENKDVRRFAKDMTRDHGKADGQVVALAKQKKIGLALIEDPESNPLADLSGVAFDRAYISAMITGHEEALAFLDKAGGDSNDADIKRLVDKLQPVVMHHKQMAQKIAGAVSAMNDR